MQTGRGMVPTLYYMSATLKATCSTVVHVEDDTPLVIEVLLLA